VLLDEMDDGDLLRLMKTLDETGLVRHPTARLADGALHVDMLVRATRRAAAERAGVRIVEVAHRAAGLPHLGRNTTCSAAPQGSRA